VKVQFLAVMTATAAAAAGAEAAPAQPAKIPVIAEKDFGAAPLPSLTRPVAVRRLSKGIGEMTTIYFRPPCDDPAEYPRYKMNAFLYAPGKYAHFAWCQNGEPYFVDTWGGLSALAEIKRRLALGSLQDTSDAFFTWQDFEIWRTIRIDYWSMPKLEKVWFQRMTTGERPAAAKPVVAKGAPDASAILAAHARAYASSYNGQTTGVAGEVAYPSPFGGVAYYERRRIANLSCQPLKSAGYRCTYSIAKAYEAAPDSLYGAFSAAFARSTTLTQFTYDFLWRRGAWSSADLDASVAKNAADARVQQEEAAEQARDMRDEQRRDRFNACIQEIRYVPCSY
jgi:hypothetical protein